MTTIQPVDFKFIPRTSVFDSKANYAVLYGNPTDTYTAQNIQNSLKISSIGKQIIPLGQYGWASTGYFNVLNSGLSITDKNNNTLASWPLPLQFSQGFQIYFLKVSSSLLNTSFMQNVQNALALIKNNSYYISSASELEFAGNDPLFSSASNPNWCNSGIYQQSGIYYCGYPSNANTSEGCGGGTAGLVTFPSDSSGNNSLDSVVSAGIGKSSYLQGVWITVPNLTDDLNTVSVNIKNSLSLLQLSTGVTKNIVYLNSIQFNSSNDILAFENLIRTIYPTSSITRYSDFAEVINVNYTWNAGFCNCAICFNDMPSSYSNGANDFVFGYVSLPGSGPGCGNGDKNIELCGYPLNYLKPMPVWITVDQTADSPSIIQNKINALVSQNLFQFFGSDGIPTFICQISDVSQQGQSLNSLTAIKNLLPQVQAIYPGSNVAIVNDLNIITSAIFAGNALASNYDTIGALYQDELTTTIFTGYPNQSPSSGTTPASVWPDQGSNNVWIRIPTASDSWQTVLSKLQSGMRQAQVNTTAVYFMNNTSPTFNPSFTVIPYTNRSDALFAYKSSFQYLLTQNAILASSGPSSQTYPLLSFSMSNTLSNDWTLLFTPGGSLLLVSNSALSPSPLNLGLDWNLQVLTYESESGCIYTSNNGSNLNNRNVLTIPLIAQASNFMPMGMIYHPATGIMSYGIFNSQYYWPENWPNNNPIVGNLVQKPTSSGCMQPAGPAGSNLDPFQNPWFGLTENNQLFAFPIGTYLVETFPPVESHHRPDDIYIVCVGKAANEYYDSTNGQGFFQDTDQCNSLGGGTASGIKPFIVVYQYNSQTQGWMIHANPSLVAEEYLYNPIQKMNNLLQTSPLFGPNSGVLVAPVNQSWCLPQNQSSNQCDQNQSPLTIITSTQLKTSTIGIYISAFIGNDTNFQPMLLKTTSNGLYIFGTTLSNGTTVVAWYYMPLQGGGGLQGPSVLNSGIIMNGLYDVQFVSFNTSKQYMYILGHNNVNLSNSPGATSIPIQAPFLMVYDITDPENKNLIATYQLSAGGQAGNTNICTNNYGYTHPTDCNQQNTAIPKTILPSTSSAPMIYLVSENNITTWNATNAMFLPPNQSNPNSLYLSHAIINQEESGMYNNFKSLQLPMLTQGDQIEMYVPLIKKEWQGMYQLVNSTSSNNFIVSFLPYDYVNLQMSSPDNNNTFLTNYTKSQIIGYSLSYNVLQSGTPSIVQLSAYGIKDSYPFQKFFVDAPTQNIPTSTMQKTNSYNSYPVLDISKYLEQTVYNPVIKQNYVTGNCYNDGYGNPQGMLVTDPTYGTVGYTNLGFYYPVGYDFDYGVCNPTIQSPNISSDNQMTLSGTWGLTNSYVNIPSRLQYTPFTGSGPSYNFTYYSSGPTSPTYSLVDGKLISTPGNSNYFSGPGPWQINLPSYITSNTNLSPSTGSGNNYYLDPSYCSANSSQLSNFVGYDNNGNFNQCGNSLHDYTTVTATSPGGAGLPYFEYSNTSTPIKTNTLIPGVFTNSATNLNPEFLYYNVIFHGDNSTGVGSAGFVKNTNSAGFAATIHDVNNVVYIPAINNSATPVTKIIDSPNTIYSLYGTASGQIYCVDNRNNSVFWASNPFAGETISSGTITMAFYYQQKDQTKPTWGEVYTYCSFSGNAYHSKSSSQSDFNYGQLLRVPNDGPLNHRYDDGQWFYGTIITPMAMVFTNSGNMIAMGINNLYQNSGSTPIGNQELFDWSSVQVALEFGNVLAGDTSNMEQQVLNTCWVQGCTTQARIAPQNNEIITYSSSSGNYMAGTTWPNAVNNNPYQNTNPGFDGPYGQRIGDPSVSNPTYSNWKFAISVEGCLNASNGYSQYTRTGTKFGDCDFEYDYDVGFFQQGCSGGGPFTSMTNNLPVQFSQIVFDQYGNIAQTIALWNMGPLFNVVANNNKNGYWPVVYQMDDLLYS